MKKILNKIKLYSKHQKIFSHHLIKKPKIRIYTGPGSAEGSIFHTFESIRAHVDQRYLVQPISANEIICGNWMKDTKLIIMPGGIDREYKKFLKGIGNENLKHFVENGGSYLGICAGAYYGGNRVIFAEGMKSLEVKEERDLGIFPGNVVGPVLHGYKYIPTEIHWNLSSPFKKGKKFIVYYYGGGYFESANEKSNVKILATYSENKAAIVECKVKSGLAILSGVHLEISPNRIKDSSNEFQSLAIKFDETNQDRENLLHHLLDRLGLHTNENYCKIFLTND